MYENKTNDEIFAEALIIILENQIKIKKHFGLISNEYYDCYSEREIMDYLETVK